MAPTSFLLPALPTAAPDLRHKPSLQSAVELPEDPTGLRSKEARAVASLGRATEYMAGFKAAQLGLTAADTVLHRLDLVTRCEVDAETVTAPITFGEFDAEDADYCPSKEGSEEDDLEYDSSAEVSCDDEEEEACVKAKANRFVKALQRQCDATRRAGARVAGAAKPVRSIGEVSLLGAVCEVINVNFFLRLVGLELVPVHKKITRQVISDNTILVPQKFGEMKLEEDDSDDADYGPSEESENSEDDLEDDSEAAEAQMAADEVVSCEEAEDIEFIDVKKLHAELSFDELMALHRAEQAKASYVHKCED